MPVSNNTNSEFNNTSSEVMNTSPARRSSRQLFESMGDPFKKATLRVIDISRSNKAKINTQNQLIEGLEKEQTETKASLVAMEQENAKMAQELEEIKKTMLSQESLDSYEDKITKFEADIDKLTQELTNKNMYAKQLEASNSALKTQLDQQKSEFNANKASEHRQELNKKDEEIKALQAKLKDMEEKNTELQDKNNELQDKNTQLQVINTQLQEEVTRLDEENLVLNINKKLDEESDSDNESTDDDSTDDESTDHEQEDNNNERVKQLEERIEQCVAEKNVVENLNKENAIKNKALEERVVALKTFESVNSQLVIDNKNLQKEINTLKTKYDAVCEQEKRHVKERRHIELTPSPSPSYIEKSVPKVVQDKLVKLKAENVYLKSSCKAYKKQLYRNLQNKSIDELIATEPSSSSDESSEDKGSTLGTNYTNPTTKRSTGRNPSNDLSITTPKHLVTAAAPRNNYSNSNNNSASPTLHCNNSAASPSSYRNSSTVSQSSYHINNASFTALPLNNSTPTHRKPHSSPESNVEELSHGVNFRRSSSTNRIIMSTSSTAYQSGIIPPYSLNRGSNTKATGPSVPCTSPTIGFNGLIIPPSTVSKPISTATTKRTILKPKSSKPSSKLLKFVNSRNPSRYITSAANVVPLSSIPKAQASISSSPPNDNSNTEAGSSNINHSPPQNQLQRLNNSSINTVILEQAPTNLKSKKRNSIETNHTDIQDRPAADAQEAKKRKIGF